MDRPLFLRGLRDALAFPAWIVGFSLLGVGSLAHDAGFPPLTAALSTALVWAAPGQVIFFASLSSGLAPALVALAVGLSSIRLMPMAMSILPLLARPGQGIGAQLLAAHYVAATAWVEGMRRLPPLAAEERMPYFLGFANGCLGLSTGMTLVGFYLAASLPGPLAAGLLFLTPIFFTVSLCAGARRAADWTAIGLGFALTPLFTALVGREFDLLATGLVGGSAAYLVGRRRQEAR